MMWGQQVSSVSNSNKLQHGVKIECSENLQISKYALKEPLLQKTIVLTNKTSCQYFKHLSQAYPVYSIFQQKFYNFSDVYTTFLCLSAHKKNCLLCKCQKTSKNLDKPTCNREGKAGYTAVPVPWSSHKNGLKGRKTPVQTALMLGLPRRHLFLAFQIIMHDLKSASSKTLPSAC